VPSNRPIAQLRATCATATAAAAAAAEELVDAALQDVGLAAVVCEVLLELCDACITLCQALTQLHLNPAGLQQHSNSCLRGPA
jgi:hypothetical protein